MNDLREIITRLNGQGMSNKEIAKELNRDYKSVCYYVDKYGLILNRENPPIELVGISEARCSKCGSIKNLSQFRYGRRGTSREYMETTCNACRTQKLYARLNASSEAFLNHRFYNKKLDTEAKGIAWNLTRDEYLQQFNDQAGKCFYTEIPLRLERGAGVKRDSCSLDKIIPRKGYVSGNVVFCTSRVNVAKSDFTLDEMKIWMPLWYRLLIEWAKVRIEKGLSLVDELREKVLSEEIIS